MSNNKKFVVKNGLQTQFVDFTSSNSTQNVSFTNDTLVFSGNVQVQGSFNDTANNSGLDGYILTSTANGISWVSPSIISGTSIAIKDDGSYVTNSVSSINFTGSGVSVSTIGDDVTVSITGGGGSSLTTNIVANTTQLMQVNNLYVLSNVNTTTVTLPASPTLGDIIYITVANNLLNNIVARNANKIQGLDEDLIVLVIIMVVNRKASLLQHLHMKEKFMSNMQCLY